MTWRHMSMNDVMLYDVTSCDYERCDVVRRDIMWLWEKCNDVVYRNVVGHSPYCLSNQINVPDCFIIFDP